jgi:uncharacterized repeat protein (TIGR02543 family)
MKKSILAIILTTAILLTIIPTTPTAQLKAESIINIGEYIQMGIYNEEPILWRCVDIDENGPLMLADRILTIKPFDARGEQEYSDGTLQGVLQTGSNLWETSNMRCWLNSTATEGNITWLDDCPPIEYLVNNGINEYDTEKGFLAYGNFTDNERNIIKSVTQKSILYDATATKLKIGGTTNHIYNKSIETVVENYDEAYYHNVTDQIFLLDVKQINKVFLNSNILGTNYYLGKPTQKAVDKSEYKNTSSFPLASEDYWSSWLRTPNAYSATRCLNTDGFIGYNSPYIGSYGVRPAFYINLTSLNFISGNGMQETPFTIDKGIIPTLTPTPTPTPLPLIPVNIGDYVQMGRYNDEPILWRCVDIDENGPLMLSDKILSFKPFDASGNHKYFDGTTQADVDNHRTESGSGLWETSNIRSWLNSEAVSGTVSWPDGCPPILSATAKGYNEYATEKGFLAEGNFTSTEKYSIKDVTQKVLLNVIDKPKLKEGGVIEGNSVSNISDNLYNYDISYYQKVKDKMFLLDLKQLNKTYKNRNLLGNYWKGSPTQKAIDNSKYKFYNVKDPKTFWDYWLRTPCLISNYPQRAYFSSSSGSLNSYDAFWDTVGVRPAFYINLSTAVLSSGNGKIDAPYIVERKDKKSDFIYNNLTYKNNTSSITITGGSPVNGVLEIPETIDGISVTKIAQDAFSNNQEIETIILPKSITEIESYAFSQCRNLKSANLSNVSVFGISPFYKCQNLLTINIGGTVSSLEILSDPFSGCINLNTAYFTSPQTVLINNLFKSCSDGFKIYYHDANGWNNILVNISKSIFNPNLKYTVTYIANGATAGYVPIDSTIYEYNTFFEAAYNTGNLTKNGSEFLGWNTDIDGTSIDHFEGQKYAIENDNVVLYAMWGDERPESETNKWLNNGVTWQYTLIGNSFCSIDDVSPAVGNIVIPNIINGRKVIKISDYAFYSCTELTSVKLHNNITTIGEYAFSGCAKITGITIPDSVAYIGDDAFMDCENLKNIKVDHSNTYYSSYRGVLYDKQKSYLENCPPGVNECEIPETVHTLGYGAFATCKNLVFINIPPTVTTIEDYAFYLSEGLTEINIPSNIINMTEFSIYNCSGLRNIYVDSNNSEFSSIDGILYNKDINRLIRCPGGRNWEVRIPDSVTDISETGLFACYEVSYIQAGEANQAFSSWNGILFDKTKTKLIQYPIYKEGAVEIPSSVVEIGTGAFFMSYKMSSIKLNSGIKAINPAAFIGCTGLITVTIPASVTSIGDNAFYMCSSLISVYFLGNAPQMGESVFDYCAPGFTVFYSTSSTGFSSPKWLPEQYSTMPQSSTLTFNSMGGSTVAARTVASNSLVTAPTNPTRSGYIFAGWFTSTTYTTPWVFATNKVTANTTLYAKWIASQVTGLKTVSAGYNSIKLTWTPTAGANNYEIYRASSLTGTYYLVTTIAATSVPTYTSTALGTGTTYYFKVRAYSLSGTSKTYNNYSTISSTKPLPATPTGLTSSAASYNSSKISWTAVTGASGYSVYRATSSTGTYSLVATATTNTYTNTSLLTGTTYYYKVNAYRLVGTTKVYGSQCAAIGAKVVPSTPTSLGISSPTYNSLKLTWGAVSGANGYSVYRSTSPTGTYTLLTTVTTNTYSNINLTPGTSYYYKVNAYRLVGTTKVYGSLCAAVGRKVVPTTISTLTVARYSATSIKLSWGAISGATGYEIYRSTSAAGTYTLVTTLTAISYTNTSLVTGTTYYYKVRAYRLVGTTKVYADFSAVKYAKP